MHVSSTHIHITVDPLGRGPQGTGRWPAPFSVGKSMDDQGCAYGRAHQCPPALFVGGSGNHQQWPALFVGGSGNHQLQCQIQSHSIPHMHAPHCTGRPPYCTRCTPKAARSITCMSHCTHHTHPHPLLRQAHVSCNTPVPTGTSCPCRALPQNPAPAHRLRPEVPPRPLVLLP